MSERWEPGQSTVSGARPSEKAGGVPSEQEFAGRKFLAAPALERLGQELIERHQVLSWIKEGQADQDLKYLILYRWRDRAGKAGGVVQRSGASKVSGVLTSLTDATWVVWVAADEARRHNAFSLEACLFHALMHLHEEETTNLEEETVIVPRIRGHEFEGFYEEVALYGVWTDALIGAEKVFGRQLKLDMTGRSTATDDDEETVLDDALDPDGDDVELDEALSKARAAELVAAAGPLTPRYDAENDLYLNDQGDAYADRIVEDAHAELTGARA